MYVRLSNLRPLTRHLCLEGERSADLGNVSKRSIERRREENVEKGWPTAVESTNLVWGGVELLGIEGSAKTKGNTLTEENVVGQSSNTTVVDLSLGEAQWVNAVLGGNLKTDVVTGFGVPDGLGTSLDLGVNLVVVRGGEDAQVVGSNDGGSVKWLLVTDTEGVAGDSGLLDIVAGLSTDEETVVADNSIEVGGWALEEVEECAGVEVWLLEVQVELDALGGGGWEERAENLSLEALGDRVGELELGLKSVGGVPGLGDGGACKGVRD